MNEEKLKVMVLGDGRSFHIERYMNQLQKQNCHTCLLTHEKGNIEHQLLKKKGPIKSLHYFLSVSEIKREIDRYQPDVISAHFASGYGHIAAKANRDFKLPLVINVWGSDILIVPGKSFLHRKKTAYALEQASYVFGDSQYLIDKAKELYPFSYCKVVPWGIEQKYLSYHKASYAFSKPLRILVPRHHESVYNNLFIVEALKDLIIEEKIELTFPSFGSLYDAFVAESKAMVGKRIRLYPKKTREEFLGFMSGFDVYLSASLSDSSPVSLIEAMALGLLPVVGEIDGIREWIDSNSGFLYGLDNQKELYEIISNLCSSEQGYAQMRENNLQKVKQDAIFENNIADQIDIMKSLLRGESRGR